MAKYKIIPSSRTIVQSPISIGHKAEKGVEAIEFDLTAWVETYGSGTATIVMKRWGDSIPYPVALEIDENNKATWTLSDIDTAKAGMAYAQLNYIVGDEVVKKSDIYTFRVMDSLTGEGEPPEAYESWLEHLTRFAAEAMAEVLDIEGIVTDKTLTIDGGIADAKATGDALGALEDQFTEETDKLKADLGDLSDLKTESKTDLVSAINEAAQSGLSDAAKAALLNCFERVAWVDEHGQDYYDALESALYGSEPYWDYEWYATSGVLPEGMTANAYDFSTVPGALHVEKPVMDFDYIGDIRLYVECSLYAGDATTGNEQRQSNPQIIIKNKVVSEDQFKGCKIIASPTQESTFYVGFGVNGTTAIIPEIASRDIHAYDISAINGVYSLTIDGTEIPITQNDNTTPYINFTGIASSDGLPTNVTQIMNIKCIKYKKL